MSRAGRAAARSVPRISPPVTGELDRTPDLVETVGAARDAG